MACDLNKPDWETGYSDSLLCVACDVSDEESVIAMVQKSVETFGNIYALINTAGISIGGSVVDDTVELYKKVLGVNTIGTFLTTREVLKNMYANGTPGRIINTASIAGKNAFPNAGAYCASKAGVIQLTKSLAIEWAPYGVRVNSISPGGFDKGEPREFVAAYGDMTPLGRMGQLGKELKAAALNLASDASSYVTGHNLVVDGGFSVWR